MLSGSHDAALEVCSSVVPPVLVQLSQLKCSHLPILSLSRIDRHDCISPCFSIMCELWFELVFFHIAPHSVHPPQSGPFLERVLFPPTFIVVASFATFSSSRSLLIAWPYQERRFWVTHNFPFLVLSFRVFPWIYPRIFISVVCILCGSA